MTCFRLYRFTVKGWMLHHVKWFFLGWMISKRWNILVSFEFQSSRTKSHKILWILKLLEKFSWKSLRKVFFKAYKIIYTRKFSNISYGIMDVIHIATWKALKHFLIKTIRRKAFSVSHKSNNILAKMETCWTSKNIVH